MDTKELKRDIKVMESLIRVFQERADPAWLAGFAQRREQTIATVQAAYLEAESVADAATQDLENAERRLRQLKKEIQVRHEKPKIDRLRALAEKIRDLETS